VFRVHRCFLEADSKISSKLWIVDECKVAVFLRDSIFSPSLSAPRVTRHLCLTLQDVAQDGRALLTGNTTRNYIGWFSPAASVERDASWFSLSAIQDLSSDGKWALARLLGNRTKLVMLRTVKPAATSVQCGRFPGRVGDKRIGCRCGAASTELSGLVAEANLPDVAKTDEPASPTAETKAIMGFLTGTAVAQLVITASAFGYWRKGGVWVTRVNRPSQPR